ncbi:hypothetical protein UT300005_25040 [Clostridium sp. CTA-5]
MDYFLLKQDKRYSYTPEILNLFKQINKKHINLIDAHKVEDEKILYVKSNERNEYLDILDTQLFLVSENMKIILEKYNANVIFKMIALIDFHRSKQNIYYLPIFEEVEALSEDAELNLNKTVVKKIILSEEKIKNKKIFKIKESSNTLVVVRLDVAESLLRRNFEGIYLERLEIREK